MRGREGALGGVAVYYDRIIEMPLPAPDPAPAQPLDETAEPTSDGVPVTIPADLPETKTDLARGFKQRGRSWDGRQPAA